MPRSFPFTHHLAPTGASATAVIVQEPPTAAPGDTGAEGGGGDPDGGSASPAAADPAAEPPAGDGPADQRELTEVTEDVALEALAAPMEGFTFEASGGDERIDENDDDDDDSAAEPIRKAPVPAAPLKRRASSRVKGVAAPEVSDVTTGTKRGMKTAEGGESAAAGAARASGTDVLADEASGASSEHDEDDAQDESVAAHRLALLASGAAAIDENDKKNQHPPGVWGIRSPTGYLLAKERVAEMDHKNEEPWEAEVWNVVEDPGGGIDVVNAQPVPRLYEQKSRALLTVPFMGKLTDDDMQGLEPHARIYPTSFHQPKGEFKGTLLSCIGLLYCDDADKAKPYNKWRGTLHRDEKTNTKRFISEICAGYSVKLNTNCKPMMRRPRSRCCTRFTRGAATSASRSLPSRR